MVREMGRIGLEMHGVTLNLRCDHGAWLEYTACLMKDHVRAPAESPDLEITGHWLPEPPPDAGSEARGGPGGHRGRSEPGAPWFDRFRDRNLALGFGRRGAHFAFEVLYRYHPSEKKLAKNPDYEQRKFFDLLRYLVLFPIAWRLERTRGWILVHAAAVGADGQAVLLAGPGGSGKTTTCVALAARDGMSLVTENLAFWDGERVHPVGEPVRLSPESLALLGGADAGLEPVGLPGGSRSKTLFRLPAGSAPGGIRPSALFLLRFSRRTSADRIAADLGCELLGANNRLALELGDYDSYTAALDSLWPEPGHADARFQRLKHLTQAIPCYALGIDRSAGVGPVVDTILESLKGRRRRPGREVQHG